MGVFPAWWVEWIQVWANEWMIKKRTCRMQRNTERLQRTTTAIVPVQYVLFDPHNNKSFFDTTHITCISENPKISCFPKKRMRGELSDVGMWQKWGLFFSRGEGSGVGGDDSPLLNFLLWAFLLRFCFFRPLENDLTGTCTVLPVESGLQQPVQ